MASLAATLLALGDDKRRGVVEALAERRVSAGELADQMEVTPAVLTRHLRVLRDAGLVRATFDPQDQRRHVYELQPVPLRELRDWVDDVSAFWTKQLASFADYVENASLAGTRTRRERGEGRANR